MTREEFRNYVDFLRSQDEISYDVYSGLMDGIDTLEQESRWTPVSEGFPTKKDGYFVSVKKGYVTTALWCGTAEYWHNVIAWMPFPKPYKTAREEAEKRAENMTYFEPIYNLKQAKSVPYREAIFSKVNELPNELEQEPILDKLRAEIKYHSEHFINDDGEDCLALYEDDVVEILDKILDKYKVESEGEDADTN